VDPKADDAALPQGIRTLVKNAGASTAEMQKQIQKAEGEAKDAREKLKTAEGEAKDAREKLKTAEADARQARERLKTADATSAEMQKQILKAEGEAKDAREKLKTAEADARQTQEKLKTAEAATSAARTQLKTVEAEARQARERLQTAEAATSAAQTQLKTAEARAKQAAADADASKAALKKVQEELVNAKVVGTGADETALLQGVRNLIQAATNAEKTVKVPVVSSTPNPQDADKHYAAGLSRYFGRRYSDAEAEFLQAIANDSQDARYYYFLGLARVMQGKQAADDFAQGAALEQQDRPGLEAVSRSLERVQGPERSIVNESRKRPR
jgi:hypothetical protein